MSQNGNQRSISIDTENKIEGTLFGTGKVAVILVPGKSFDKESWYPQAKVMANNGYKALSIDFTSEKFGGSNSEKELVTVIKYMVSEEDVKEIILIGASAGGYSSLLANKLIGKGEIDGTVAIAPPGELDFIDEVTGRFALVVGESDEIIDPNYVYDAYDKASTPKDLVKYDTSAHAQNIFDTNHGNDLLDYIIEFIGDVD